MKQQKPNRLISRTAAMLLTVIMAFAGAQTAGANVGDVVATGYCGTTANGADGHNLAWTLTENGEPDIELSSGTYTALTLTITGSGDMDDYTNDTRPWNETNKYRKRVTKLVLPDGITHIGNHAFYFPNFTGPLTIPSTVQTIGDFGIYFFTKATSVTIPASVTSIGEYGLLSFGLYAASCSVTFAEGSQLASIGANAFESVNANLDLRNCTKLTAITKEEVFLKYNKTVTFPRSLTSICKNAFKSLTNNAEDKPTVKLYYKGVLFINGEYLSYNANGSVRTITSQFNIKETGSKAVTIRQVMINGLTWNDDGKYFEIADEQDLIDLGNYVIANWENNCKGLTFKMTADLDFSDMPDDYGNGTGNFQPIGQDDMLFGGHFDGDGHSIIGLRFSYEGNRAGLFFGIEDASAVIECVTLVSPNISGQGYVGGIVGYLQAGTVRNCAVVGGTICTSIQSVGGIVGFSAYSQSTDVKSIVGCSVVGTTVSGVNEVGLIVGANTPNSSATAALTIKDCTYHNPDDLDICGFGFGDRYTDGGGNQRVYQLTLSEGITATGANYSHALVPDKAYYASGSTVALSGTPTAPDGYMFADYSASPAQTISNGSFTMPAEDVSVSATWTPDPDDFAVNDAGTEYTIKTAAGWGVFCDRLAADDGKAFFTGKKVKLAADITVSRMAGSDHHDFCGTFDGQEHTLTFNYNTGTDDAAPFRYVEDGCVIENLRVCGTIETSAKFAAGLVAHQYGNVTIRNCRSSVTIKSSVSSGNGDGTHGGFVAENCKDGDITFEGCLFDGKLLKTGGTGTNRCGGFVGWRSNNTEAVIKVKNSLYAPAALEVGEYWISTTESATFVRNGIASDITNSYYTSDFNDGSSFTGQGKQRRSIAAGEGVSIGHDGAATEYSVSGITAYKASGASGDNDPFIAGIIYNNVLYAGSGDEVSLTLSNSAPAPGRGYQYAYTANAGSLDGSTLTMPDEDVTVSVDTETLAPIDWATESTGEDLDHAYVIYNKDQLDLLAQRVNSGTGDDYAASGYSGKYFVLGDNIEYSHKADNEEGADTESNYTAIGRGDRSFKGHFYGQGHTISGIRIYKDGTSVSTDSYQGLFGLTGDGAVIRGITLADARITSYDFTGGIAGANGGSITDCHVAADVTIHNIWSTSDMHGGIVGVNSGTVSDCTSTATLTAGDEDYGGIVGNTYGGTLSHNLAIGAVVPAACDNRHGAICGRNDNNIGSGILENNYYYGCKVASNDVTATGVGCGHIDDGQGGYTTADVTDNNGAVPAYLVTLNDGVTIQNAMASDLGFSYGGKNYCREGAELPLVLPALPTDVPLGYLKYAYTANGKEISGTTLTVGHEDITVKRTLIVDPAVGKLLTLAINGDGTVEMDECTGMSDNGDGTYAVLPGTTISVKATPAADSYFKNWNTEADINSNVAVTSTFTVTDNMTLTANFVAKPVLTLTADGNGTVDMQGFTYGEKNIISNSSITVRDESGSFADQGGDKLFDGIYTGDNKWCTEYDDKYVEFYTPSAVKVNGYTLYTANDNSSNPGRNPKSWVLKAGSDGVNWTTIASVTNDNTMMDVDYTPFDFQMDDPGTYQYFRFEVSAVHDDNILQLGELQLFYQETIPLEGVTKGATANTYIVDYGTAITVKATPAGDKCVKNWDSDDPIIPATTAAVEKTYTLTENTTATAHFASYHPLTPDEDLTVNGVPVSKGGAISVPTGATVVLSHHQEGYTAHYAVNTTPIDGNTFAMPDENVTVTVTFTQKNVLALSDNGDNASAIATAAESGEVYEVTLSGRTLYKDGAWNTLCLPFSLGNSSVEDGHHFDGTPLAGATVKELDTEAGSYAHITGFDNGTLYLNFKDAASIVAGRPYIVKWPIPGGYVPYADPTDADAYAAWLAADADKRDIHDPVFEGVTVSNATNNVFSEDGYLAFVGTYSPEPIYASPATNLYLGGDNTLYYPTATDFTVKSCRGYFQLRNGLTAGEHSSSVRAFTLNFGDGSEANGIEEVTTPLSPARGAGGEAWYTLDGVRLDAQPTRKGLYIHGGRKVVIK